MTLPKNFYQSAAWRTLRAQHLRQEPWCRRCLWHRKRKVKATNVDHIKTIAERPDLALFSANLQSLCQSHHSRKTAREDGGFGRHNLAPKGCDVNGVPLDPKHPWNAAGNA